MIIDIHTHCFPDKIASRAMSLLHQESGYPYFHDGSLAGLTRSTLSAGIDLSVILPIATRPEQTLSINRWAVQILGGAITSFGTIHPEFAGWKAEIRWLKEAGIKGIKMHPEYQGFYVDDERYFPLYEDIFEAGLVILFHAGGDIAYNPPFHCEPKHLSRLLDAFPGGVVIAAHMGGYQFWNEAEDLLFGRQVFIDTSFSIDQLGADRAIQIMRLHGIEKVLFGTDSPWHDQAADLAEFASLDLTPDERAAVLGGNAARLLGLAEKPEYTWISSRTGTKIRKAREDKGLAQSEFAAQINASQAQIDHYERGGLDMPVARLFDMAVILDIPAADLLDE
jgi:DNA-binding transcriptional regulator YiaG